MLISYFTSNSKENIIYILTEAYLLMYYEAYLLIHN